MTIELTNLAYGHEAPEPVISRTTLRTHAEMRVTDDVINGRSGVAASAE